MPNKFTATPPEDLDCMCGSGVGEPCRETVGVFKRRSRCPERGKKMGDIPPKLVGYKSLLHAGYSWDEYGLRTKKRFWQVNVQRLSDGACTTKTFRWRWRGRRFQNSTRRMGKAFDKKTHISPAGEEKTILM